MDIADYFGFCGEDLNDIGDFDPNFASFRDKIINIEIENNPGIRLFICRDNFKLLNIRFKNITINIVEITRHLISQAIR